MADPPDPVIRYDQTPGSRFFMCRHCRNHILSEENCLYRARLVNGIVCQNPVNVRADDIRWRWWLTSHCPVVNVCCNECNRNLGQKFVTGVQPNPGIREGRFMFYPNRMLFWNGTREVYADTKQPVEDN